MKLTRLAGIIGFIALLSTFVPGLLAQDSVTQEILRLVNQARNENDIPSLLSNDALIAAAQRHSDDMATTGTLAHTGSDGSEFWQRMSDANYPLTTGGENVLYRFDTVAISVYEQWRDSLAHEANMMNPDFIEIGLAYTEASDGTYYFTMLLGARDDVTPPPIMTPTATSVPVTAQPTFTPFIAQTTPQEAAQQATSLPQPVATQTTPPTQVAAVNTAIPSPTTIPITLTPAPPVATNTLAPTSTRATLPTATLPPLPDVRLLYDNSRFTLVNISGRDIDLENLTFESRSGDFTVDAFSVYIQQPLLRFPAGDCLQIMLQTTDGTPRTPSECGTMKGWIVIYNDTEDFWRDTTLFTVMNGETQVAICDASANSCEFSLSADVTETDEETIIAGSSSDVSVPDLRLFYDTQRFTLLNIAGQPLNLEGLEFVSRSGSLDALLWTQYISQSIANFPDSYCLQMLTGRGEPVNPPGCTTMRGWFVNFSDARLFWQNADVFSVNYRGIRVGVCDTTAAECDITLSDNLGTAIEPDVDAQSSAATDNSQATTTDSTSATVSDSNNDIRLLISSESFALLNTSGQSLNLSGLSFESDSGTLFATAWDIEGLSRPLTDFTTGGCLQVWGVNEENVAVPSDCRVRHAWILVAPERQFWRNVSSFSVLNNQQVIATCETSASTCDFDLP